MQQNAFITAEPTLLILFPNELKKFKEAIYNECNLYDKIATLFTSLAFFTLYLKT